MAVVSWTTDAGSYRNEDGVPEAMGEMSEGEFAIFENEKALSKCSGLLISGGTDGTRTRDPLRDRQVF